MEVVMSIIKYILIIILVIKFRSSKKIIPSLIYAVINIIPILISIDELSNQLAISHLGGYSGSTVLLTILLYFVLSFIESIISFAIVDKIDADNNIVYYIQFLAIIGLFNMLLGAVL